MKTDLTPALLATERGQTADAILRACVHCGFCNASCPTYRVVGNELDGPRGRIYLIKAMLEGEPVTRATQTHLDRCLTCRACESACPSGVEYHRLLNIGRDEIERRTLRPLHARVLRWLLGRILPYRRRFTPLLRLGQSVRWWLPERLRALIPPPPGTRPPTPPPTPRQRHMIVMQGCVQPALSPATNRAVRHVLDALGIEAITVPAEGCCGALSYHLSAQRAGVEFARRNIDAWWPWVEQGVDAIVMTASGCGLFVRDYHRLFADDPVYADKAAHITALLKDISEVLVNEDLESLAVKPSTKLSWHCPCTAQHGQALDQPTRAVLSRLGFEVPTVTDAHLCCGSAGTYSLLHPDIARTLRRRKLANLEASQPEHIVTANIGCQIHLAGGTETPVTHWIELVDGLMSTG